MKGCTSVFRNTEAQTSLAKSKGFCCPQRAPSSKPLCTCTVALNHSLSSFIPEENHCQIISLDLKLNFLCKKRQPSHSKTTNIHLKCFRLNVCYIYYVYQYYLGHDTSKKAVMSICFRVVLYFLGGGGEGTSANTLPFRMRYPRRAFCLFCFGFFF